MKKSDRRREEQTNVCCHDEKRLNSRLKISFLRSNKKKQTHQNNDDDDQKKKIADVEEEQLSRIQRIQKKKDCDRNHAKNFEWSKWSDWINDKTFKWIDRAMRKSQSRWE